MKTILLKKIKRCLLTTSLVLGFVLSGKTQTLDPGAPAGAQVQPVNVTFTTISGTATIQKWNSAYPSGGTPTIGGFVYNFNSVPVNTSGVSMNTNGHCGEFVIRAGSIGNIRANGLAVVAGTNVIIGGTSYSTFTLPVSILSAQPWGRESSDKTDLSPSCNFEDLYLGPGAYQDITLAGNTYYDFEWVNHNTSHGAITVISGGTGNDGPFTITTTTSHNAWYSGSTNVKIRVWAVRNNCAWTGNGAKFSYRKSKPTLTANNPTAASSCPGSPVSIQAGSTSPASATIYWQNTNANGTSTTNSNTTNNVSTAGTYYYRSYLNGCWGDPQPTVITAGNEYLTIDAGPDKIIECTGSVGLEGTVSNSMPGFTYFEDFNGCNASNCHGWTISGGYQPGINNWISCSNQAANDNIWSGQPDSYLTSNGAVFISNGQPATFSFNYKTENHSNYNPVPAGYCTFRTQWSSDNGANWNTVSTFSNQNNTNCNPHTSTFTPPAGQSIRLRVYAQRNNGDFDFVIDDISVTQAAPAPTITWTGGPIASGQGTITPTVNPTTTTTYTVTATAPGACPVSDQVTVTVKPLAAGTIQTPLAVCEGEPFQLLSVGGLSTGQWQVQNGASWNNITGATTNPYMLPSAPSVSTKYRFRANCGLNTMLSNELTITIKDPIDCYCIPEYTNACTGNDQINKVKMVGETVTIENSSGCSNNFPQNYSDYTYLSAADLLEGQTYDITVTSTETTVPLNERVNVWIDFNDDGIFQASEKVAAHGGTGLIGSPGNYYRTFSIPIAMGTNPGQHRMRVRMVGMNTGDTGDFDACSHEDWGETEDYVVNIIPLQNCAGTPVTGTASGPTTICKYESFTLTATGTEVSQGISYAWEYSTSGGSTWAPVPGATNTTLVVSTGIATATLYRLKVTCANGSTTNYSNIVSITLNAPVDCYCVPVGTTNGHEILNVTIQDVNGEYLNNTSALGENTDGYVDYTGTVPVANLDAGVPYQFSIYTGPGLANHGVAVWIDFNNNGTFDPNEKVLWDNPIFPNTTFTKTLTIPTSAPVQPGIHRMRVKYRHNQGGHQIEPCTVNSDSETEDYLVNITIPPPCTGTPNPGVIANYGNICKPLNHNAFTISSTGVSVGMGITYKWQQRATGSGPGAWVNAVNGTSSSLNLPNGINNDTDFRLIVKCENSGTEAISNAITIKVKVCYCEPAGQNNSHEIVNFQLQENASPNTVVLNNSSAPNEGVNGYADYTDDLIPPNLFIGDSYRPQITSGSGSGNHGVAVWIDYNDDGVFAANERVSFANLVQGSSTVTLSEFTVLGSPGIHRMRVQYHSNKAAHNLDPCSMSNNAETEDYFVRVISKDCPDYSNNIVATGEACAGQPYSMVVKNTACDGKIYLEVRGGQFNIKRLNGLQVESGNATSNYMFLGPFDPNVIGRQLKLEVSSGTVSIWNNGKLVVDGATASSTTEYDFVVNPVISPATFIITTPSGNVSRSIKDCRDVFMTLPLANTNFCKPITIELPWQIKCDATNADLGHGTHSVTVYPQTPGSMDDIVKINWDPNDCTWAIDPQNDCDLLDLGTVFDITPDPEGEAYSDGCFTGDRQFTAIYNGVPGSPGCCENGGPITGYAFYNIAKDDYTKSSSPSYPDVYDAAQLLIPSYGNNGGFATNFNLTVNVNNYCRKPFNNLPQDLNDYRIYVYVDGLLAYYKYDITGNSTSTITLDDLYVDYTYLSDIRILVLPTWNKVTGLGGADGEFVPVATCANINTGGQARWTADVSASLNVIFEDVMGSSADCAPQATVHHVECAAIEKSDEIEHKNPIQPYYCYGNTIDLEVSGGTNIQDNKSDEVNVWYAVPGDNTTQCDMEAPFSELWNSWEYRVENLCGGASASHYQTNPTVANGIANLKVTGTGTDPWVWMSPFAFNQTINASTYKYINVRFRIPNPSTTSGATSTMELFYTTDACGPGYAFAQTHSKSRVIDVTTDEWQIASFDMGSNANWAGAITGLRFDYLRNKVYVDEMDVDFIIPSKYPMVGEGHNLIIEPGDEYYTELTTTYYSKKINRCGFTECENTLVDFPGKDNASTLSGNGENTTCWVKGDRPVHFYTRDITIDNQDPGSQPAKNYVATVNPNGNEAILTIYSHLKPNVDVMAPCDDNTSLDEYHTAYMQRGFQVRVENAITNTADYDVYFPFTSPELNALINVTSGGGGDITPDNTFDNVSSINDIWATQYHGPQENNTPHDNDCIAGESVVIAPTLRGTTLNHIFNLDPNYTFVPGVSPANNFVQFTVPDFSEFWFHGQNNGSPLSVQLTEFTVNCEDDGAHVTWTTASEHNSDYYTVESSRDGSSWTVIATVDGAGNTNTVSNYEIVDPSAMKGYYRLVQVDYDGATKTYGPISSDCSPEVNNLYVYPNPTAGTFTVEINATFALGNSNIVIQEITGRKVGEQKANIHSGVNNVYFNEQQFAPGTYIISIEGADRSKFPPAKLVVK